jgi:hypothetical protein
MVKRKPGSNAYEPDDKDRQQVLALVGMGLTHDQIAKVMDISDETLRKHFRHELDTGSAKMNAKVAQNLFHIATSKGTGSVAAAIFWMKTRAGWREKDRLEITGANGGPIKTEGTIIDSAQLSAEHRAALRAVIEASREIADED